MLELLLGYLIALSLDIPAENEQNHGIVDQDEETTPDLNFDPSHQQRLVITKLEQVDLLVVENEVNGGRNFEDDHKHSYGYCCPDIQILVQLVLSLALP